MSDPEIRMSDLADATRHARGPRRLWVVTGKASPDDDEPVHLLIFAVAESQACALAAASAWDHDPLEWSAVAPDLGTGPDVIRPRYYGDTGRYIGVWDAPDALWAALGYTPSEDWRWCDCCGRVVHVDDWQGDGDECDECDDGGMTNG